MTSWSKRLDVDGPTGLEMESRVIREQAAQAQDEHEDGCDLECTRCGGEGVHEGDRPGWDVPGELVPCRACGGSGDRRDQRVF